MRDNTGKIIYIGKALDLSKRVASYFQNMEGLPTKRSFLVSSIYHIDYIPASSEREALLIEQRLINRLQPYYNTMWKDGKSYPFVKLTAGEDFPRIFLTRKKVRDRSKYFGPFPSAFAVRRLLRYLWRKKYFPLRPCQYEFSEKIPLAPEKIKSCLYYHTKECPAPCAGRISKKDYQQIATEADLFFTGKHSSLKVAWEKEMKEASQLQDFERAGQIRDNLNALAHIAERVTVRQIDPEELIGYVDRSRATTELQKALFLPKPPVRIECFDISHIQGVETVASMVVFEAGQPKKEDYRKFKIKTVTGIDDFASMGEVVGRRYRRLRDEQRPLPDLVLIDGGKGQLSAAQTAIRKVLESTRIPLMASLAKQEEELFLPDRSESIRLPADSPARLLVQAVRDEAHRFAITFHRTRRAKRFLSH